MQRNSPLITKEHYHIYNRGAGKQVIFKSERDSMRFQVLLYLANSLKPVRFEDLVAKNKTQGRSLRDVFSDENPDQSLVDVLAYSLMPNHFHIALRQKADSGITTYMRKVCTAYSMYFNTKYERNGVLFQGRFKSSHVDADPYLKWIFSYIHLNPISLVEPLWEEKVIAKPLHAMEFLNDYRYSSYYDYYVAERPERAILAYDEAQNLIDKKSDFEDMLSEFGKGRVLFADDVKKADEETKIKPIP